MTEVRVLRLLKVTIFVTSVLLSLAAEAAGPASRRVRPAAAEPAPQALNFAFRMQGMQTANRFSEPYAYLATSLEYNFYKTYAVAVDVSFLQTVRDLRTKTQEGWNDTVLSLTDKELWKNTQYQLTLKGTLSATFVTSKASQESSMQYGAGQSLALTKGFGDRFSVTYGISATEYSYEYETAYEDDEYTIYNTQWMIGNRLMASYSVTSAFRVMSGATVLSYHTTGNENYSALLLFGGISYDPVKTATLDIGVRSGYKRGEDPITWNGPATSKNLLGADGTLIFLATTIKI